MKESLNLKSIDNIKREFICDTILENKNNRNLLIALRRIIEIKFKAIKEFKELEESK